MKKKPQFHRNAQPVTPKKSGGTVTLRHMDGFPKQTCQVYTGGRKQAKHVILKYQERFGVLPQIAFLCKGNRWYLPVPDEGGV